MSDFSGNVASAAAGFTINKVKKMIMLAPIIVDLPPDIAVSIGQIMAVWSFHDWKLQQIIYKLLDIDPKKGRVAAGQPRGAEVTKRIEELLMLHNINIDLAPIRKNISTLEQQRDMLGHGVWLRNPENGDIYVQRTSGKWQPPGEIDGTSRRIKPEAVKIDVAYLEDQREKMKAQAALAETLFNQVVLSLQASQKDS